MHVTFPRAMKGKATPPVIVSIGGGAVWCQNSKVTASSSDNNGFDLMYYSDRTGDVYISWVAVGRNS